MREIIDCFKITPDYIARNSNANPLAEGLWFVAVASLIVADIPPAIGQSVTITRRDGSTITVKIVGVDVHDAVWALQFEGVNKEDIPRLSRLVWEIGSAT